MKRIDLADLCFGKIEDAASAIFLSKARQKEQNEIDSIVCVDSQLKIYNDAKSVSEENRKFDLLSNVQRLLGEWKEVLNTVNIHDRIYSKPFAYSYGRNSTKQQEQQELSFQEWLFKAMTWSSCLTTLLRETRLKLISNFSSQRKLPCGKQFIHFEITQTLAFDRIELIGWSFDPKQRLGWSFVSKKLMNFYSRVVIWNSQFSWFQEKNSIRPKISLKQLPEQRCHSQ